MLWRLRHALALCAGVLLLASVLAGCGNAAGQTLQAAPTLSATLTADLSIVTGQTVFVPAYSQIFYESADQVVNLTTTLAIHNADLTNPIIVRSVRYYNTDGVLVRDYVEAPIQLAPMASTGFVVERDDVSGGWGANFLVEWGAETPVYEPVIEAVMVSRQGIEAVPFISVGRVVSEQMP